MPGAVTNDQDHPTRGGGVLANDYPWHYLGISRDTQTVRMGPGIVDLDLPTMTIFCLFLLFFMYEKAEIGLTVGRSR